MSKDEEIPTDSGGKEFLHSQMESRHNIFFKGQCATFISAGGLWQVFQRLNPLSKIKASPGQAESEESEDDEKKDDSGGSQESGAAAAAQLGGKSGLG